MKTFTPGYWNSERINDKYAIKSIKGHNVAFVYNEADVNVLTNAVRLLYAAQELLLVIDADKNKATTPEIERLREMIKESLPKGS